MRFNDSTDKELSLYHNTLSLLGISESDTTTLPLDGTFTRLANIWYRRVDSWIWQSAKYVWKFDDANYTDLPTATADLASSQEDYEIPSTARSIERVEVKDSSGNFRLLKAIDQEQVNIALDEFQETDGIPRFYWMEGRSLFLKPNPSTSQVTATAGLKITFGRDISEFTPADTTKEPGFDNHFHPAICYGVAIDWGTPRGYTQEETNTWTRRLTEIRTELQGFYGSRHTDMKKRIVPARSNRM